MSILITHNFFFFFFFSKIGSLRQMDNNLMFPNLSSFMQTLLCLPHSSATVERVFSAHKQDEN